MANILDIYRRYKTMPQLQLHQLRVAAVAQQICDNFQGQIDQDSIIKACLLHDMGNILKFDLTKFPDFLQPQGLDYWQQVKAEYLKKYGPDEHNASLEIAQQLGMTPFIKECIDAVSFNKTPANAAQSNMAIKICEYGDDRVGPHGILSLEDRMADLRRRYDYRIKERGGDDSPNKKFEAAARLIEKQIFAKVSIKPSDITKKSVQPIIEQLKTYEI